MTHVVDSAPFNPGPRTGDGAGSMPKTKVALSVIIVHWKVPALLRTALTSLYEHTRLARTDFEVFVVDNASGDGTVEMLARDFPEVIVIANSENAGFGRANNQAFRRCRGNYILALNPDTEIRDDAIGTMVRYMDAHPDVGALGCRLLNTDGSYQRWTAGAFPTLGRIASHALFLDILLKRFITLQSVFLSRDVDHDIDVDWVTGACLLLRRTSVGDFIFDEKFFVYGEDTELCHRLKAAGWRVVYTPSATVVHHQGRSMAQQTGDFLLVSLKGPRAFYVAVNGSGTVRLYDFFVSAGFFLRWVLFGMASAVTGGRYRARADSSYMYLKRSLLVMGGR